MKFEVFSGLVAQLREYYTGIKDLKDGGIDLTKLEAHNNLYTVFLSYLFETATFEMGMAIIELASSNEELSSEVLSKVYRDNNPKPETARECTCNHKEEYKVNNKSVSKDDFEKALQEFEKRVGEAFNSIFTIPTND